MDGLCEGDRHARRIAMFLFALFALLLSMLTGLQAFA